MEGMSIITQSSVLISNQEDSPVVFSDPVLHFQMDWEPKGDSAGGDIRTVPADIFDRSVSFIDAIRKGVLKIEQADESVMEKINLQVQTYQKSRASSAQAAIASIDPAKAGGEQVGVACVGPGTRPGNDCGELLAMRSIDVAERPPLCNRHKHLSDQYVGVQQEPDPNNPKKVKIRWDQVKMAPTLKQTTDGQEQTTDGQEQTTDGQEQ
jgi:hypothetical protein